MLAIELVASMVVHSAPEMVEMMVFYWAVGMVCMTERTMVTEMVHLMGFWTAVWMAAYLVVLSAIRMAARMVDSLDPQPADLKGHYLGQQMVAMMETQKAEMTVAKTVDLWAGSTADGTADSMVLPMVLVSASWSVEMWDF